MPTFQYVPVRAVPLMLIALLCGCGDQAGTPPPAAPVTTGTYKAPPPLMKLEFVKLEEDFVQPRFINIGLRVTNEDMLVLESVVVRIDGSVSDSRELLPKGKLLGPGQSHTASFSLMKGSVNPDYRDVSVRIESWRAAPPGTPAPPTVAVITPAPKPPTPVNEAFKDHPALPAAFACEDELSAEGKAIRSSNDHLILSRESDFLNKDFDLDVLFEADPKSHLIFVGMGPVPPRGYNETTSARVRIHRPGLADGYVGIAPLNKEIKFAHLKSAGPHLVRLAKRGMAVTWSLDLDHDGGEFKPDASIAFDDVRKFVPHQLTKDNTKVYYGGAGIFHKVTLTEHGPSSGDPVDHPAMPAAFTSHDPVTLLKDGVRTQGRSYIRTRDAGFIEKDFDLDLVFRMDRDDDIMFIGLSGDSESHRGEPAKAAWLRIHAPHLGEGRVHFTHGVTERGVDVGKLTSYGPHMIRFSKRGNKVTCSLDHDYDGQFKPDSTGTAPDVRAMQPALTKENSHLIYGSGGVFMSVKLNLADEK